MPKASQNQFYAVHAGRIPGVYKTWDECQAQVTGFSKPAFKKFRTLSEAEIFLKYGPSGPCHITSPDVAQSSTTTLTTPTIENPLTKKTYSQRRNEKQKRGEKKEADIDERGWDVVYTDGACSNNGQAGAVAGIGVWWGENDPRNISERCPDGQTNNRAELIAIIRVLEMHLITRTPLLIKTDSSYSISCIRDWLPNWKKKGWKTANGQDVKNKELIVYLSELLDERGRQGQPVKFQHVRGHQGLVGNEAADFLARQGTSLPHFTRKFVTKSEIEISEVSIVSRDTSLFDYIN